MKKIVTTLLTAVLLVSAFFIGSSEASAMTSKGTKYVNFHTDADTYSKHATSIVVTGTMKTPNKGCLVLLINKKGDIVKYIQHYIRNTRSFRVSFLTKDLPAGKYDVVVQAPLGPNTFKRELKHYITVQH
ncbi:hypothetical protein PJ311_02195 [Bacillus sp. CLL-7-23]|uniref:Uncharacterized protein n=1 Tax=Bacillus changyiensis TaxID=3004103 RepID=A0ABT4WZT1_9BACI|nr:hypothetical protein [Bacillus changyiensis]MDA7025420.1 hypothetical protein [Bacillus changyiensis]